METYAYRMYAYTNNIGCFAMTPDTRSVAGSPIRPEEHITEEDLIQEEMNDLEPEIFVNERKHTQLRGK